MMYWVLLHGSVDRPFLIAWTLWPPGTLALLLAGLGYGLAWQRVRLAGGSQPESWRVWAFYSGLFATALALIGPFDAFNGESFFIHMGQHVLMMLVAPPLLLLGRPVQLVLRALPAHRSGPILRVLLRRGWLRGSLTVLTHPLVVFVIFNLNLVVWHWPDFYVAALHNELIHEIEHATFMWTALLFWWVLLDPVPRHHRLSPERAILLLFTTGAVGDLVGLALTLSPRVIYPFYLETGHPWDWSVIADQRLGGVVMLASGSLVYFGTIFLIFARSVRQPPLPAPAPISDQPQPPAPERISRPV